MDIDKLLLQLLRNEDASKEYETLEEWKQEAAKALEALNNMEGEASINAGTSNYKSYDKQAAWGKISKQIDNSSDTPTPQKPSNNKWMWVGIAALFLVAASIFIYNTNQVNEVEEEKMYKSQAENMAFALQDDSQVWLREGGSILSIESDFTKDRRVKLEGEAFFDISKDVDRPFIVELSNNDFIKVLGTSFNVIHKGNKLDLVVYSGVVELHTLNRVLTLQKGDMATRLKGSITLNKNKDNNKISWKTNHLVFEGTSLNKVFDAVENHYGVTISVDKGNPMCRDRTKFSGEKIEAVIKELAELSGFKYEITDNQINVSDINCKK